MKDDARVYTSHEKVWQTRAGSSYETFMSFEEYILGREARIESWKASYLSLQKSPDATDVALSSRIQSGIPAWCSTTTYEKWNSALYADEVFKKFGTLTIVEPTPIPVGMVSVFKNSKISWDS